MSGHSYISIVFLVVIIFVFTGTLLPYVNDAVDQEQTGFSADNIIDDIDENDADFSGFTGTTNAWRIIVSVFSMFFWTFGSLPFWLDMCFVPLRIVLAVSIAKMVRG